MQSFKLPQGILGNACKNSKLNRSKLQTLLEKDSSGSSQVIGRSCMSMKSKMSYDPRPSLLHLYARSFSQNLPSHISEMTLR